jgi:signal transduction histidine kinase
MADGYTQPIVSDKEDGKFIVVDGFHRNRVGKECADVLERVHGYLPVVQIREEQADRNNRARGLNTVEQMRAYCREKFQVRKAPGTWWKAEALSKIAAGRLELAYARVEIAPLLALVAKLFSAAAAKAGVELSVDSTDAALALEADPMRLQQVLMNLVSNAVKFTPNGGQVRLFAVGGDAGLRIGVADTGIGMTPEEAARATEPFVQIDAQLTRRHGGTGLGLAICKELVGLHGGALTIESAKGQGTRVTAELPLAPRA